MKLTTKTFSDLARRLVTQRTQYRPQLIHPRRDWYIGLFCGLLVLIGVATWSGYMYTSNRSVGNQTDSTAQIATPVYRAASVAAALEYFTQRQETFAEVQLAPAPVVTDDVDAAAAATSTPATVTDSGEGEEIPITNEEGGAPVPNGGTDPLPGVTDDSALAPQLGQ